VTLWHYFIAVGSASNRLPSSINARTATWSHEPNVGTQVAKPESRSD